MIKHLLGEQRTFICSAGHTHHYSIKNPGVKSWAPHHMIEIQSSDCAHNTLQTHKDVVNERNYYRETAENTKKYAFTLESSLAAEKASKQSLQSTLSSSQTTNTNLSRECTNLKTQINGLQSLTTQKDTEINTLKAQLAKLQAEKQELAGKVTTCSTAINEKDLEICEQQNKIAQGITKEREHETELKQQRCTISQLSVEVSSLRAQVEQDAKALERQARESHKEIQHLRSVLVQEQQFRKLEAQRGPRACRISR